LSSEYYDCPGGYICPAAIDWYDKCENNTYCAPNTLEQITCPAGFYGSSDPQNWNFTSGCTGCTAGFYALFEDNTCTPCPAGYVCTGNTTVADPQDDEEGGYICPAGYYCPEGSI